MKKLILVLTLLVITPMVYALDFYADAYKFQETNHTGVIGLQGDRWGGELSVYDLSASVTHRSYLEFNNLEIGAEFELTNSVVNDALDNRVVDIEGGYFLVAKPYVKVGSDLFAIFTVDESNAIVLKVGFNLY